MYDLLCGVGSHDYGACQVQICRGAVGPEMQGGVAAAVQPKITCPTSLSCSGEAGPFALFRTSSDCMTHTHFIEGNLL